MKIFYSELTANPAYYSFGYSVYGEFEDGDMLSDCYEKGFLPFVGTRKQSPRAMFMARGVRVLLHEFIEKHYHSRVRHKVALRFPEGITVVVYKRGAHKGLDKVHAFFLSYFYFRFGKESMPPDRLFAIIHSPFVTHIAEYSYQGKIIGYSLEVHADTFIHVWHQAYAKEHVHTHLGVYLYLELLERAKKAKMHHLYFGVTYGTWMNYKTNFQPLEFWNGAQWIKDSKSTLLKELFKRDGTRQIAFTDEWRKNQDPYYDTPYPFSSRFSELRYLYIFAVLHPRIIGVYLILVSSLTLLVCFKFFF